MNIKEIFFKIFGKKKILQISSNSSNEASNLEMGKIIKEIIFSMKSDTYNFKYTISSDSIVFFDEAQSIRFKSKIYPDEMNRFYNIIKDDIIEWKEKFDSNDKNSDKWLFGITYSNGKEERYSSNEQFPDNWGSFINTFALFAERNDISDFIKKFMRILVYAVLCKSNEEDKKLENCVNLSSGGLNAVCSVVYREMPDNHPARNLYDEVVSIRFMELVKVKAQTEILIHEYIKKYSDVNKHILKCIKDEKDIDKLIDAIMKLENIKVDYNEKNNNYNNESRDTPLNHGNQDTIIESERLGLRFELPKSLTIIEIGKYKDIGISEKTELIIKDQKNDYMTIVCDGKLKKEKNIEAINLVELNIENIKKNGNKVKQPNIATLKEKIDSKYMEILSDTHQVIVDTIEGVRILQIYFVVEKYLYCASWKIKQNKDFDEIFASKMDNNFMQIIESIYSNNKILKLNMDNYIVEYDFIEDANNKKKEDIKAEKNKKIIINCSNCGTDFVLNWNVPKDEEVFYCKCPNCKSEIKTKNPNYKGV
ncbi:MAG: hypothetical protein IJH12_06435 [Clostridia bacterium]|nr:hypothetical protein [Clostridia bacterium]